MKLVLDYWVNPEIKEYLLTQEGINKVEFSEDKSLTVLNIEYNKKITPMIIMQFIELFLQNKCPILFEFDKEYKSNFKTLKYTVKKICCEYCYRGLIMDLFENKKIKSAKSNFDISKQNSDIDLVIEYDDDYPEKELIEYIKSKNF